MQILDFEEKKGWHLGHLSIFTWRSMNFCHLSSSSCAPGSQSKNKNVWFCRLAQNSYTNLLAGFLTWVNIQILTRRSVLCTLKKQARHMTWHMERSHALPTTTQEVNISGCQSIIYARLDSESLISWERLCRKKSPHSSRGKFSKTGCRNQGERVSRLPLFLTWTSAKKIMNPPKTHSLVYMIRDKKMKFTF